MPICASKCAIWERRIRLQEVVISEGLWNYLKAVIRSGLIELMMCWRDDILRMCLSVLINYKERGALCIFLF